MTTSENDNVDRSPGAPDVATPRPETFPIVGIGASAGGLAAFEAFFSGMPPDADTGMAFVLVQHLAPDHKSMLSSLVSRYTRMRVQEVEDGMPIRPDCAYIIPPNRNMSVRGGALHLVEQDRQHGVRLPIDYLFRSLAEDQHERAISIVLSGTGSDGTLGTRAIKGEGGLTLAQSPDSTEFTGMPQSAIDTGMVDMVVAPNEMPARLLAYVERAWWNAAQPGAPAGAGNESGLRTVLALVKTHTGHDLSPYKPSTIVRRVRRRMAVLQIETMEAYARFLCGAPSELDALFYDLLIGVTSFFRDGPAFAALEEHVLPALFDGHGEDSMIRIWVPGCATGEEAYSLAILVQERLEERRRGPGMLIFATDIDSRAILHARTGVYPASITADVSPERLARHFTREPGGAYRISKNIRSSVIFSKQDVTRDPPFSRLDLIACRNVLIYMGAELQKRLIPLFHYALKPNGFLLLGMSETVGEFANEYTAVDRKARLYRRNLSPMPGRAAGPIGVSGPSSSPAPARVPTRPKHEVDSSLREIIERELLRHTSPVGVLVNLRGDILYLHGRTGQFLEPTAGAAGLNVLRMARDGLRPSLAGALETAAATQDIASRDPVRVGTNGSWTDVRVTVRPVRQERIGSHGADLFVVAFDEVPKPGSGAQADAEAPAGQATPQATDERVDALRRDVMAKEDRIRTLQEEMETSCEELQSANEELQSVNEELQSTNEELETSKEELQALNEELTTINAELHSSIVELSRANNDMNNLLAGTGIGTLFTDHDLRILRFTPPAAKVINLIPADVGRPIGHIASKLMDYSSLEADIQSVLDTLISKHIEVQTANGAWYLMHIRPYRTLENAIEGAVVTFDEITEMRKAREALRETQILRRMAPAIIDSRDPVILQDLTGQALAWNPAACSMYGWTEAEALELKASDRISAGTVQRELAALGGLNRGEALDPYAAERLCKDGSTIRVLVTATALVKDDGEVYGVASTERKLDT
ncbi:MAG: PAS domain-containing protein [Armatimonadetes bacterium]|nr:PAS domain-containing protein [Armatimonadota bacterium]